MLITVIGKSYSAKRISDCLAENDKYIVFTTADSTLANKIDISPNNVDEIKDFINANEISLLIIGDKNYYSQNYEEVINETECCVLCFENMAQKLCTNISSAKKFAYKNKIQTPKFATFEKLAIALEYLQTATFPLVIMPDSINQTQVGYIAETKDKAKKEIEKLFETDNKKIMVENYIQGINYTKYIVSDGLTTLDLLETVKYFDEVSTNNTNYINEIAKNKIEKEIMPTIIDSFMEEGIEFQGVLGIEFVINNNEVYFSKFKPFFDDLDIDIAIETIENECLTVLYKCATGTLAEGKNIKTKPIYAISIDNKDEFITTTAKTITNAIKIAKIEGANNKLIDEAIKNWER